MPYPLLYLGMPQCEIKAIFINIIKSCKELENLSGEDHKSQSSKKSSYVLEKSFCIVDQPGSAC